MLRKLRTGALLALSVWSLGAAAAQTASQSAWLAKQRAATEKAESILGEAQKRPGLLSQYQFMLDNYVSAKDKAFRLIFGQYVAWYQTYLGIYDSTRTTFSIRQPAEKDDASSPLEGRDYTAQPAADAIAVLARGRKAVFFNEAHTAPVTRTLTVQMLARLRADGFDTFAAETLYSTDKDLATRGYPVAESGFYTKEPIYAEMVRTALKLGYRVIAYEAESNATGDAREAEQARNLYQRAFKEHPEARLVVNAGYAHIVESGAYLGGMSMAQHFRKISGIDPLTVEQTMLIPHDTPDKDHPYYRAVIERLHPTTPIVFVHKDGTPWSLKAGYDLSVFFPEEALRRSRPTWASIGGLRVPYFVSSDMCSNNYPCLIEARYADEGDDAIPADRAMLYPIAANVAAVERTLRLKTEPTTDLYLRPGRYRLTATSIDNRLLSRRDILVQVGNVDTAP
ncbi:MAG TPA: hypothetical protein VF216_01185 [Mizugakiibacter sp.]